MSFYGRFCLMVILLKLKNFGISRTTQLNITMQLFKVKDKKCCAFQQSQYISADHITSNFLKAVFHKFHFVHS